MTDQAKAALFDLYPRDREALARIRERMQIKSNALAVRLAIRDLAARLDAGRSMPIQPDPDQQPAISAEVRDRSAK
jgi:hypothetical protein